MNKYKKRLFILSDRENFYMHMIKHILLIGFLVCMSGLFQFSMADGNMTSHKKILHWIDPMEPTVHYGNPGKSRMGMDVVPVYADDATSSDKAVVKISPAIVDNLGVRTEQVIQGDFTQRIETVGYINIDENTISQVHTYVDGWIRKLLIKAAGEKVAKGQLILQFYSPVLNEAQEEYLITLNDPSSHLTQAAHQKLLALGISENQIQQIKKSHQLNQLIDIYSPQNGIISELNVREGMQVTPSTTIMSLADLKDVWMMAEVYETQAQLVSAGQEAEARLSSLPGKILKGRIDYVYPQVDPTTRTLKIRLRFDNPDNQLKPGMYANISLLAKSKSNVISIPQEALIRTEQGDRVIVALGNGRFEPRIVTAGIESGNRIEITSGLKQGESVVTSAQFLIDSEANLKGALDRLTPVDPPVNTGSISQPNRTQSSSSATHQEVQKTDIVGVGVIKNVKVAEHQLTISHQPIRALQWPAMTMDFSVVKEIDLSQLKPGNTIQFHLKQNGQNSDEFFITSITKTKV